MYVEDCSEAVHVSVVVPVLNEAQNIDALVSRLLRAFHDDGRSVEVLFADGGSTDGTWQKVQAWVSIAPVRFIRAESGRGLAGDVLVAAREARARVIVVMDADLSHSPEEAPVLARAVLEGRHDMVIGSRYIAGGRTPQWAWTRRAMSRIAAMLVWPLTDVHDPTSGFFAIRRERLLEVGPDAEGFKIALELLLRNDEELRVAEYPICFHDRSVGQSKMGLRQVTCYLRRSAALAGAAVNAGTAGRFALIGLIGLVADVAVFRGLWDLGMNLALAHILSFALATTLGYVLNSRWVFAPAAVLSHGQAPSTRLIVVCLMALFLRGGVLAMLTQEAGWSLQRALVAAALVAAAVNYLGNAFFVFRQDARLPSVLSWRVAAVALVGYTVLLRLVYLGLPDLLPEEAYYWNYTQHPDVSYLDHPPMVAWLIGFGTAVFGNTEFGIRIGTFLCWFVTAGFAFGFARHLFGKSAALVTVMLIAVLPFFFLFGFFTTPDAPLTACWAGALFFLERALLANRRWAWLGTGICVGLGLLSKYTIILLGPPALMFILLDRRNRHWLRRPEPYVATLLALLLFTPVVLWNMQHDWASFAFQGTRRFRGHPEFGLHMLVISMIGLITPVGVIDAFRAMLSRRNWQAGLDTTDAEARRKRLFAIAFTLAPLSVFVFFSIRHGPKPNWTGPLWLGVLPAIARQLLLVPRDLMKRPCAFVHSAWTPVLAGTILLFGGFLHYVVIGLPGAGVDDDMHLPVAWEELGRDVEQIEEEIEADLGIEPLVVGMDKYFLASELAFYRRDGQEGIQQTSSRHLFGDTGLMYAFWFPPREQAGRVLLLVSFKRDHINDPKVARSVDQIGPIEQRTIHKYGGHVRYFYRIAYGYRPSRGRIRS